MITMVVMNEGVLMRRRRRQGLKVLSLVHKTHLMKMIDHSIVIDHPHRMNILNKTIALNSQLNLPHVLIAMIVIYHRVDEIMNKAV
jgi:hypothetical protein